MALERLNEFLDGELSADQDTEVREHLAVCEACRKQVDHQRAFLARLARVGEPPAPDALRERIRSALRPRQG